MEEKVNAIVIKSVNYRENDKMLTLFTLEKGLVGACLRGAKKANAKLGFAGELFCFGEFVLVEKDGRHTVVEVNQVDSFYGLRLDCDKLYAATSIAEFVNNFMLDGMKSYQLFLNVINALKTLANEDISPKIVLACFYLNGLSLAGYAMDFSVCSICKKPIVNRAFFAFNDGVSVCSNCASATDTEIRFSTYELLKKCSKIGGDFSKDKLCEISADEESQTNVLRFIDFLLRNNADVNIKSHKFFI